MPRITALAALPRRHGLYRLDLDGTARALVDAELVLALQLRVGADVDARVVARIDDGAARFAAVDEGMDALAVRARSEKELARWLAQKGHAPEHAGAAVERLVALGLLDDAAFARAFARSRAVGRGMSRRRIQAELARRGVAREIVDAALAAVMEDEGVDDLTLVEAAAKKKLRSLARLEPDVQRRRLYGYLGRQGFPSALIHDVVRRLAGGPGGETSSGEE